MTKSVKSMARKSGSISNYQKNRQNITAYRNEKHVNKSTNIVNKEANE